MNDAAKQTWDELYKKHVDDYKQFFDRVDFQLEGTQNKLTTNTLIDQYNGGNGANALMLERLYFAYGRYLEIASSRGVDLPANLQVSGTTLTRWLGTLTSIRTSMCR